MAVSCACYIAAGDIPGTTAIHGYGIGNSSPLTLAASVCLQTVRLRNTTTKFGFLQQANTKKQKQQTV